MRVQIWDFNYNKITKNMFTKFKHIMEEEICYVQYKIIVNNELSY